MFCEDCNLDKKGVKQVKKSGDIAIIVNKLLHGRGKAHKFAVANTVAVWIDSVHATLDKAVSRAEELSVR